MEPLRPTHLWHWKERPVTPSLLVASVSIRPLPPQHSNEQYIQKVCILSGNVMDVSLCCKSLLCAGTKANAFLISRSGWNFYIILTRVKGQPCLSVENGKAVDVYKKPVSLSMSPFLSRTPWNHTLKTRKAHRGKLIQMIYLPTGPNWEERQESLDHLRTELRGMGTELGGVHRSRINGAALSTLCFHPSSRQSQSPGQK